jgi:hypothetical protein
LLFIPPVVLGSFALQSIESPKGLKSKMVGQVSEVKGNWSRCISSSFTCVKSALWSQCN